METTASVAVQALADAALSPDSVLVPPGQGRLDLGLEHSGRQHPGSQPVSVHAASVPLTAGKTVASITLPAISKRRGRQPERKAHLRDGLAG